MSLLSCNRQKKFFRFSSLKEGIIQTLTLHKSSDYISTFDCIESLLKTFPNFHITILALAYDLYESIPIKTRFNLYQSRFFEFNIKSNSKVLDIGSGHMPFPYATHLADFSIDDNNYGRAGVQFKNIKGLPVFSCNVEKMPFEDNEFDFVYCSHVLEHVDNPEKACCELSRVGKRGYIETPNRGKDIFLSTAKLSNHKWHIEYYNENLFFTKYTSREINGIGTNILMNMHTNPQTDREKAFSAAIYLQADLFNTMVMWEQNIPCVVRS